MDGSLDLGWLGAVVLHDVNLAAARPTDAVIAQHPERGPDGLAGRNLNVGFDPAVLKVKATAAVELRLEARGKIRTARQISFDHQMAVAVQERGRAIADHVFDLAGAEDTLTGFEGPKLVIAARGRKNSGRAVELITENRCPPILYLCVGKRRQK